jgi:hypothetical protein
MLQDANSTFQYTVEEIFEITVESDFYEDDSTETKIANFTLTRMTDRTLDI